MEIDFCKFNNNSYFLKSCKIKIDLGNNYEKVNIQIDFCKFNKNSNFLKSCKIKIDLENKIRFQQLLLVMLNLGWTINPYC